MKSIFEVQAVINSKLRENKIRTDSILVSEIVEDLISETIASPLLDGKRKEIILENLKRIYSKGELFEVVEKFNVKQVDTIYKKKLDFEEQVKEVFEKRQQLEDELRSAKVKQIHIQERFSSYFGWIASMLTLTGVIISLGTEPKLLELFKPIKNFISSDGYLFINLLACIFTSILASSLAFLIRKVTIKNREKK